MASSTSNVLGPESLLDHMKKSLPTAGTDRARVKDPYAAIALFTHACMLAVGFKLIGLGEDHQIEASSESQDVQPLPSEWDGQSTYAFRYKHPQSSMEYLVKVSRLGSKALIFAVALGDDKTVQLEVKIQDYISENALKEINAQTEASAASLQAVFVSPSRLADLGSLFRSSIIQRLAPGISKEGYQESTTTEEEAGASRQRPDRPEPNERRDPGFDPLHDDRGPAPARPHPFHDPLAAAPRPGRPIPDFAPPGFEDEHELQRPLRGGLPGMGNEPFGRIGEQDLYPPGLGPHDPLRMGPGGIRGGGGMHPTFDDPLFGGRGGNGGYDPRAPPGARYDPVGPDDDPPMGAMGGRFPGRGPGGGGGGGGGGFGGPPNPFSGFGHGDFI